MEKKERKKKSKAMTELFSYLEPEKQSLTSREGWGLEEDGEPTLVSVVVEREPLEAAPSTGIWPWGGGRTSRTWKQKFRDQDFWVQALMSLLAILLVVWAVYWLVNTARTLVKRKRQESKVETAKNASSAANKSALANYGNNNMALMDDSRTSTTKEALRGGGILQANPPLAKTGLTFSPSAALISTSTDGCIYGGLERPVCIGCKTIDPSSTFVPTRNTNNDLRALVGEYYPRDPFTV